ncbi:tRNA (cytosine(38)-C(5))-methyltransferase [Cheilinus undulatus]|uniref:tRNA (cytosine(38)-C(5))-methyltransferase n=1 Tax=Cheilinus undulatus TaxID=241271 RepID=UPI001BD1DFAD|nr:tRNA (cytosine(38)-C(5))-methyltransferase [Cheilinus undulatus]
MEELRVLELYSGIGGMHYAIKDSGIPFQVVAAIDINTIANQIYQHNFPDTPLWNKTIEGITLDDFNKLSFDMILMSPPCQPFTRLGHQGDIADPRTKSFLYILDILPRLCKRPRLILLENVKGFESSSARERLVKTLKECGYTYQEIMISPPSVGIPNSRLRYYLIAKISTETFSAETRSKILEAFPHAAETDSPVFPYPTETIPPEQHAVSSLSTPDTCQPEEDMQGGHFLYKLETMIEVQRKMNQNNDLSVRQIRDFLEPQTEDKVEKFLLPPKTLLRYAQILDIVQPTCRRSVCFTKGYGRYVEGTGSVLQSCMETEMASIFRGLDQCSEDEKLQQLFKLKLRYFTPREVANLMGFPQSFSFPEQISTKQQYRVLGNSLNVVVVARLLQLMIS